jgi:D-glycerate 3-kinase
MSVFDKVYPFILCHFHSNPNNILTVGIGATQGAGKTTLVGKLKTELQGLRVQTISLDDYYYDPSDLQKNKVEMLRSRGPPGTTDILLLVNHLTMIKQGKVVELCQFAKHLNDGKGGRTDSVLSVKDPNIILIEGWSLGFQKSKTELKGDFVEINEYLSDYEKLYQLLDLIIYIKPSRLDYIYQWRLEQEHELIRSTGMGMTDDQVKLFVDSFIPFYNIYDHKQLLRYTKDSCYVIIDFDRNLLSYSC